MNTAHLCACLQSHTHDVIPHQFSTRNPWEVAGSQRQQFSSCRPVRGRETQTGSMAADTPPLCYLHTHTCTHEMGSVSLLCLLEDKVKVFVCWICSFVHWEGRHKHNIEIAWA